MTQANPYIPINAIAPITSPHLFLLMCVVCRPHLSKIRQIIYRSFFHLRIKPFQCALTTRRKPIYKDIFFTLCRASRFTNTVKQSRMIFRHFLHAHCLYTLIVCHITHLTFHSIFLILQTLL